MKVDQIIRQLIEILERKSEVVKEILALTLAQGNLIGQEELGKLSDIIEEKQGCINQVNELDLAFVEAYEHLKSAAKVASIEALDIKAYPELVQVKQLVGHVMALLKRIEEVDKANQAKIHKDFEVLKEDMNKLKTGQQGKKIMSTYTKKYADMQGVFIDNKNKY